LTRGPEDFCQTKRGLIVVAANSAWNIVNFRGGLIRALQWAGYTIVVIGPADPASSHRIAALGVEHVEITLSRSGLNPIADARLLLSYRRVLKTLRPVAFLGFTIKPNVYGSLAAWSLGVPAIANISGLGTTFAKGGLLRRAVSYLYRFSLARCATVFFQNPDDLAEFIQRRIVRLEKARLLPGSGIDLEHFAWAPLPPGPVTFLLAARLLSDKGIREYVAAAKSVRDRFPDARFQLLGPVDQDNPTAIAASELREWAEEGPVKYLGIAEDVRPFIAEASVVVLPSYYREGVPHILLEAAAMGRPIITTDAPGCREAIEDGTTGFSCSPGSVSSLANAMAEMLALSPSARERMGLAGRRKMKLQFRELLVHEAYLQALNNIRRFEQN
jgi:glycosyltransferase involved in cell wall biosynthesis